MPPASRKANHKHQPTLYLLQNSHIESLSSFPTPKIRQNITYLPTLNHMASIFNPMKSMKRKVKAALSNINSRKRTASSPRPLQNHFSPIIVNANIAPIRPKLPHLQIPLQLVPPMLSIVQDKPLNPQPTTSEIFESIRMEHLTDLLSGLNAHQETKLFNALVRMKAEILQMADSPKDSQNNKLPLPRRRQSTFAQAYAAASFDSPATVSPSSATTASSESYIMDTLLSSLPDFEIPTSKDPTFGFPISNIPTIHSSHTVPSSFYSTQSLALETASSTQDFSLYSDAQSLSSDLIFDTTESRDPLCSCTSECIRNSLGHVLETQKICDNCLQWVHRAGSRSDSLFKLEPLPAPQYATRRNRSYLAQRPVAPVEAIHTGCDFDLVYDMLNDFEFIQSRLQHCEDPMVTKIAEQRLEELFDMICHRSTAAGFVDVSLDDGFAAVQLYSEMFSIHGDLEGETQGELRTDAERLIRDMHDRICLLLQLKGCEGK